MDNAAPKKVIATDTDVLVRNLKPEELITAKAAMKFYHEGNKARKTAPTTMNRSSSRSHAIFTLQICSKWEEEGTLHKLQSKINLVDLAGSENATNETGVRQDEGIKINISLSALENVLRQREMGEQHVSYRNSQLTLFLRESLKGNCKISIIVNVSASRASEKQTLYALKFGLRTKNIESKIEINTSSVSQKEERKVNKRLEGILKDKAAENDGLKEELKTTIDKLKTAEEKIKQLELQIEENERNEILREGLEISTTHNHYLSVTSRINNVFGWISNNQNPQNDFKLILKNLQNLKNLKSQYQKEEKERLLKLLTFSH